MQVGEEHRGLAGVIGQSKKLITKYARREFTDKVCIAEDINVHVGECRGNIC